MEWAVSSERTCLEEIWNSRQSSSVQIWNYFLHAENSGRQRKEGLLKLGRVIFSCNSIQLLTQMSLIGRWLHVLPLQTHKQIFPGQGETLASVKTWCPTGHYLTISYLFLCKYPGVRLIWVSSCIHFPSFGDNILHVLLVWKCVIICRGQNMRGP